jgi:hypothetical protein
MLSRVSSYELCAIGRMDKSENKAGAKPDSSSAGQGKYITIDLGKSKANGY